MHQFFEYERDFCSKVSNKHMPAFENQSNDVEVSIKDIYAPLALKNIGDFVFRSLEESAILTLKEANKPKRNMDEVTSILLYETAGAGKTMFMKRLALALLENDPSDWDFIADLPHEFKNKVKKGLTIPIYVDLNASKEDLPKTESLYELLYWALCKMYPESFTKNVPQDEFKILFDSLVNNGKVCLMLDHLYAQGFEKEMLIRIIDCLREKNPNNVVISAARTTNVREFFLADIFDDDYRLVFSDNSKRTLVHKLELFDNTYGKKTSLVLDSWVKNRLHYAPGPWSELAQTPLGLTKLYTITKRNFGEIPKNKAIVYETLVDNALEGLTDEKTEKALRSVLESLGELVWDGTELDVCGWDEFIDQIYYKRPALMPIENTVENNDKLEKLLRVSGLVVTYLELESGEFNYTFLKNEMKHYMSACGILRWAEGQSYSVLDYIRSISKGIKNDEVLKFLLLIAETDVKNGMIEDMFKGDTNESFIAERLLFMFDNWDAFRPASVTLLFSHIGKSRVLTAISLDQIEHMIKQMVPPECFPGYGYLLAIALETKEPYDYAERFIECDSKKYKEDALFIIWCLNNRFNLTELFPDHFRIMDMNNPHRLNPNRSLECGIDFGTTYQRQYPEPWNHLWNASDLALSEEDKEIMNRFDEEFKAFSSERYVYTVDPLFHWQKMRRKLSILDLIHKVYDYND